VHARPDREPQPESEEDEPDPGPPRIGVGGVAPKRPEPNKEDRDGDDHQPDPQLARPRDAALLHGEGRKDPVQPERRPADGEDELYRSRLEAFAVQAGQRCEPSSPVDQSGGTTAVASYSTAVAPHGQLNTATLLGIGAGVTK
jgi:hypothetical protein